MLVTTFASNVARLRAVADALVISKTDLAPFGAVLRECLDGIEAQTFGDFEVLVVDDEADTCELLSSVLSRCGAQVTAASSASEGFKLFKLVRPDVMVSDIGMPLEDGYELIRKVRALPEAGGGKVPAVALTAYARSEDRMRALHAGYQMHVAKPIELGELVSIVASLADRLHK